MAVFDAFTRRFRFQECAPEPHRVVPTTVGAMSWGVSFLEHAWHVDYTLAVDRADEAVSHLYDPLHPAVLRLLALAISTANNGISAIRCNSIITKRLMHYLKSDCPNLPEDRR